MIVALYDATFVLHVAAGIACALAVVVPLWGRKGQLAHRVSGWCFVAALLLTAITGFVFAAAWMIAPALVKPLPSTASPERVAAQVAALRQFAPFFVGIGVLAVAAAWHGISATRQRRGGAWRGFAVGDRIAIASCVVAGLGLIAWGIVHESLLFVGFGALGVHSGYDDRKLLAAIRDEPRLWIVRHLQAMIGGATVVLTAFTVQAVPRLIGGGSFRAWIWLAPVAVGWAAATVWTRSITRKMKRDTHEASPVGSQVVTSAAS